MIPHLTITNLAAHEDYAVDFTSGVNRIRATSKSGKSSISIALSLAI